MIYLDNSATTKPCVTAIKYINSALTQNWGNPSSLHTMGIEAEELLKKARKTLAQGIGANASELYFTGGGTESNNIAVLGAARKLRRRGNRIVTTAIEHPSVKEAINALENEGFEVIRLMPQRNGVISKEDLFSAINEKTILVSIMLVNNEVGSIQPVVTAKEAIIKSGSPALLHTDAVQAYGKMPINVKNLGVDLLSISGHKIHGPKGIGFLYVKKGVLLSPTVFGGGQETGLRSGTQPMPSIAGLLGAYEELPDISLQLGIQKNLWNYAVNKLSMLDFITINSNDNALPYILNISVNGYKSETVLHALEAEGIFVSSGSACAKGKKSYVLDSMGLSQKQIDSSIRISFSRFNTEDEIDSLCEALIKLTKFLRKAY